MKFSSTSTLFVLKSLCIKGGSRLCRWFKPATAFSLTPSFARASGPQGHKEGKSQSFFLPLAAPMAIESLCLNSSRVAEPFLVSGRLYEASEVIKQERLQSFFLTKCKHYHTDGHRHCHWARTHTPAFVDPLLDSNQWELRCFGDESLTTT